MILLISVQTTRSADSCNVPRSAKPRRPSGHQIIWYDKHNDPSAMTAFPKRIMHIFTGLKTVAFIYLYFLSCRFPKNRRCIIKRYYVSILLAFKRHVAAAPSSFEKSPSFLFRRSHISQIVIQSFPQTNSNAYHSLTNVLKEYLSNLFLPKNALEAINNVIDVVSFQRKIERRNILITIITFSAIVMLLFLIDVMQWEGFIMICLPIIMLGTGLYLIGLSIYRSRQRLTYTTTLILGILALLFPLLIFLFLCFAFILGGPVPA